MIKFVSIGTAAFFLACLSAFGQTGARRDGYVFNQQGGTVAGATVRVCSTGWIGQPCTPLASLFSDIALTQPLSNPITTDQNGHYFYYVATATYEEEISGMGLPVKQTPDITITEPATGGGGSSFPAPTASGQVPYSTDNTIANVSWPSIPQCAIDGTQIGVYDPGNLTGSGPFACVLNPRLNAVIQTPSIANGGNLIIPGDLSTPSLVFQQIASQTQPFVIFNNSSGGLLGYIDSGANAFLQTFTVLNSNPVSAWKYGSAPSGAAVAGFVRLYVDSTAKVLCTNDDAGNDNCPLTFSGVGTFTNKTFDTAGTGNIFKINGQGITATTGAVATVVSAGTISGTSQILCTDSSTGTTATTSGCPVPFIPANASQSSLAVTGTGNQLVTVTTPSATGSYKVQVIPIITTQPVSCTTYGSFDLHVGWQDSTSGTVQVFDSGVIPIVAGSIVGAFSNQGVIVPINATGGQPIQAGIKVTIASNTCTTSAVLATKLEVTQ